LYVVFIYGIIIKKETDIMIVVVFRMVLSPFILDINYFLLFEAFREQTSGETHRFGRQVFWFIHYLIQI